MSCAPSILAAPGLHRLQTRFISAPRPRPHHHRISRTIFIPPHHTHQPKPISISSSSSSSFHRSFDPFFSGNSIHPILRLPHSFLCSTYCCICIVCGSLVLVRFVHARGRNKGGRHTLLVPLSIRSSRTLFCSSSMRTISPCIFLLESC